MGRVRSKSLLAGGHVSLSSWECWSLGGGSGVALHLLDDSSGPTCDFPSAFRTRVPAKRHDRGLRRLRCLSTGSCTGHAARKPLKNRQSLGGDTENCSPSFGTGRATPATCAGIRFDRSCGRGSSRARLSEGWVSILVRGARLRQACRPEQPWVVSDRDVAETLETRSQAPLSRNCRLQAWLGAGPRGALKLTDVCHGDR